ncbi:MAG: hypothetical protein M3277_06720 [Actinomycetota bacterium]|nr:hypothetical protein [Actinomycetota bacterium]
MSAKKRESKKKRRPNKKAPSRKATPRPRPVRTDVDLYALWDERRAGARNVAGVTYQIAVTAHLLVAGRAKTLPVVAVTPEGLEDVDCDLDPSSWDASRLFVQSKERAEGDASLGIADIADFLAHALEGVANDRAARLALITDAAFGTDIRESGWTETAWETLTPEGVQRLRPLLPETIELEAVLRRTHLVRLPFDLAAEVTLTLASTFDVAPVVGGLALARLVQDLSDVAAGQRGTSATLPLRRTRDDLATLLSEVLRVVDASSLMTAEMERIIGPVDFLKPLDIPPETFLAGVDVRPGHIAANLDVPRPSELGQIVDGLTEANMVLVVGPSGAGKSALVWRAAAALSGFVRPFRLRSCRNDEVPKILDYVDSLAPSPTTPILVCADDLGREPTSGWEPLANALLERPGVRLLGAAREEDFAPSLAVRRAALVRPALTRDVAHGISGVLASEGVAAAVSVDEAFQRSKQLLMEFLTILITGDRLSDVVGEQVHALLSDDRRTEREVLRWISAAHVLGTSMPAQALQALVGEADLAPALNRLRLEHFILETSGTSWQGLHELRSGVATRVLHETPPPDLISTWSGLLIELPPGKREHVAPRVARMTEAQALDLAPLAKSIGKFIREAPLDAPSAADLVSSLKRAESMRHAVGCLEAIRGFGRPKMDIVDLLRVLAGVRFQGIDFFADAGTSPDRVFARMVEALPERPALRDMMLEELDVSTIVGLAQDAPTEQAIALLESLERTSLSLTPEDCQNLLSAHSSAVVRDKASIIATLMAHGLPLGDVDRLEGSPSTRLHTLANEELVVRDSELSQAADGAVATVTVITIPQPDADPHGEAVDMARLVLDLVPEVDIAEIVMLGVDGERYRQGGHETAYKRLSRDALPRTPAKDEMKGLIDAAHELTAATYWTERLREQADLFAILRRLMEDIPQRLLDPRDAGRRRWQTDVESFKTRADALKTAPLSQALEASLSESERRERDPSRDALQKAGAALGQLAAELPDLPPHRLRGISMQLREARRFLSRAYLLGTVTLADVEDPLPKDVDEAVAAAADMLLVLADEPRIQELPRSGARNVWIEFGGQFLAEERDGVMASEREAIEGAMTAHRVSGTIAFAGPTPDQTPTLRIVDGQWVVTVDLGDWESGSFLESIPQECLASLAGRLSALPLSRGFVLPLGGAALTSNGVTGMTSDAIEAVSGVIGMSVYKPPAYKAVVEAIPALMQASAYVAAARIGNQSPADAKALKAVPQLLAAARERVRTCGVQEIIEVWEELCHGVEDEVAGSREDGLATQTAGVVRGEPPGDLVQTMQRALFLGALSD